MMHVPDDRSEIGRWLSLHGVDGARDREDPAFVEENGKKIQGDPPRPEDRPDWIVTGKAGAAGEIGVQYSAWCGRLNIVTQYIVGFLMMKNDLHRMSWYMWPAMLLWACSSQPTDTRRDPTQSDIGTDSQIRTSSDRDIATDQETDNASGTVSSDGRGSDGEEGQGTETADGTDESNTTDTAHASDTARDTQPSIPTAPVCSEQVFRVEYLPVKLMILLDMSGSMVLPADKYPIAVNAITGMLDHFAGKFLFGFDTYPDRFEPESCSVDNPIWFDCAPGNEAGIAAWLESNTPAMATADPLLLLLRKFLEDPDYAPSFTSAEVPGDAYLVIVADGDDTCGPEAVVDWNVTWETELSEAARSLNEAGIKTIVVGYTENADGETLDGIAQNGGTAFDTHIPAMDQGALTSALDTIAGTIVGCSFEIADPGPSADPNKVNFYMDEDVVPFDNGCELGVGWTWEDDDHTFVRFCEQSCAQMNAGDIENVTATFGCPAVVVV